MDSLLRSCGFILDNWHSNRPNLVPHTGSQVPDADAVELIEFTDKTVLGLRWLPKTDEVMFKFQPPPILIPNEATKRKVLSHIAQIFDPNGYIGPVVVVAKIIMQKIWRTGQGWDEMVSDEIFREWQQFQQQLPQLTEIKLQRWLGINNQKKVDLHGFSDASELAYGAVLYARVESTVGVECHLIATKSRVAPAKTVRRLELCAAQLLSELVKTLKGSAKLEQAETTFWTDSEIVLAWPVKDATALKTFVNNRVQKINRLASGSVWRHVQSADNPADLISRGVPPAELQGASLWGKGPARLRRASEHWPCKRSRSSDQLPEAYTKEMKARDVPEEGAKLRPFRKRLLGLAGIQLREVDLLARASEANALFRLTAWVLRFIANCQRRRRGHRQLQCVRAIMADHEDIEEAMRYWVRREQEIYYAQEISKLKEGQPIDRTSSLLKFKPTLTSDGVLRLGGRLDRSLLPFEQKHPILLPEVSTMAKLLVRQAHDRTLHGGPRQMTALLRQKFWITNLRRLIRTSNLRCIACNRQRQEGMQQIMGDLPADRVRPCTPFRHSGVDYAGPFELKGRGGRTSVLEKKYVAVFVCMVMKTVHLELAEDLSTAEFIQAFLRFTSIRGACTKLWSDNGRNFIGAEKELAQILHSWRKVDMGKELQRHGTEWRFITPSAPHQGGLWEAAVKSMKYHLKRVIGPHKLTSSAFRAVLAQTSAVMNSRPLAAWSDDPNCLEFLTPAHFFLFEPTVQQFGDNVQDVPDNRLKHAARVQKMSQLIWKEWAQDYLHEYQQRPKWMEERADLKVGDLVIIREDNTPPTLCKAA